MPLKSGEGPKVISQNISEMMHKYAKKHKIGNTSPKNKKHAQKIAIAAAMSKARGN